MRSSFCFHELTRVCVSVNPCDGTLRVSCRDLQRGERLYPIDYAFPPWQRELPPLNTISYDTW
jgi:hypothetical protein